MLRAVVLRSGRQVRVMGRDCAGGLLVRVRDGAERRDVVCWSVPEVRRAVAGCWGTALLWRNGGRVNVVVRDVSHPGGRMSE